jgi:hypothetical protein
MAVKIAEINVRLTCALILRPTQPRPSLNAYFVPSDSRIDRQFLSFK